MSKGKSAKGVIVDFDLLKIKEQIASSAPSIDVQKRQDFIENRQRRKPRKKVPQSLIDAAKEVEVEKELPGVEGETAEMIPNEDTPEAAEKDTTAPTSKQKARPRPKKKSTK